jgi:hypothetical protein
MLTISKAVSEDFDRVYPLFQDFGDAPISKETWKKIFVTPWKNSEDFCGYLLLQDGAVKGYLGLIFSRRMLNDKVEKFCNMTSWVVSEDCRGKSLSMLLEVLKLKDYTLTNFTASPTVATILSKLGFTEFAVDQRILLPLPRFAGRSQGCDFDLQSIRGKLKDDDLRIFDDHQGLNCDHLLLQSHRGDCYVVLKNTVRRRVRFAKVHYLSNTDVFHDCMQRLTAAICLRLKVFGILVDERYIGGRQFIAAVKYPHQRKAFFKSSSITGPNCIDTLYSEMVILHN